MHRHPGREGKGWHTTEELVCSRLLLCLAAAGKPSICSVLLSTLCHGFTHARTCCPSQNHGVRFPEAPVKEERQGGRHKDAGLRWEMGAQGSV